MEFDSVEEAEKSIEKVKNDIYRIKSNPANSSETVVGEIIPQTNGSKSTSWSTGTLQKLNATAYYVYLWDSNRRRNCYDSCTNVTSSLTGFTLGVGWTQTGYTANIGKGDGTNSSLSITVDGYFSAYLFVKGIGEVYREPSSFSCTWHSYP